LQTLFGLTNSGGAMAVTTPATSALTVTARTYNQTSSGTYGQFIPAISPSQSVGKGERTLQILQLENSSVYRTNLGLVETTGSPVTIELSVVPEDSKVAAKLTLDLAANEFRQISLADFGFGTMYKHPRGREGRDWKWQGDCLRVGHRPDHAGPDVCGGAVTPSACWSATLCVGALCPRFWLVGAWRWSSARKSLIL